MNFVKYFYMGGTYEIVEKAINEYANENNCEPISASIAGGHVFVVFRPLDEGKKV